MAGPGLELAVLGREKEKPASLGVCRRPLVMEPQRRDLEGRSVQKRCKAIYCSVNGCDVIHLPPVPFQSLVKFTLIVNYFCANAKENTVFPSWY